MYVLTTYFFTTYKLHEEERERERERERETHTHTHTHTDRQTDKDRENKNKNKTKNKQTKTTENYTIICVNSREGQLNDSKYSKVLFAITAYSILFCSASKRVIHVYGVSEGDALCDWIYQSRDEPRSFDAKSQIQLERFHQAFCGAVTLKALRETTLRYQIFSSARR